MNTKVFRIFISLGFLLATPIAFSQNDDSFYTLINTTSGVDIVFTNTTKYKIKQTEEFIINGIEFTCQVSDYTSRSPRCFSQFYKRKDGKGFKFCDTEKYTFVIRNQRKSIEYRQPRKHILSVGINGTGKDYPKLSKARVNASNFYKIVNEPSFLPDYVAGHINMPDQGTFTYDEVARQFEAYQRDVRDEDVFVFYFGGHGDKKKEDGDNYYCVLDDDKYLYDLDLISYLKKCQKVVR